MKSSINGILVQVNYKTQQMGLLHVTDHSEYTKVVPWSRVLSMRRC